MSAPDQLSMFEPEGETLARIGQRHEREAVSLARGAELARLQGRVATAKAYERLAEEFWSLAFACEMALHFEQEAGL